MDTEQKIMKNTIDMLKTSRTYTLNMDKINTLEDVKNVLHGLNIQITLMEGLTSIQYERLKDYLK